jgi:hypothetical protein
LYELVEQTGEKFFPEYLRDQLRRNHEVVADPLTSRCLCILCGSNPIEITGETVVTVDVDVTDPTEINGETVDVNMTGNNIGSDLASYEKFREASMATPAMKSANATTTSELKKLRPVQRMPQPPLFSQQLSLAQHPNMMVPFAPAPQVFGFYPAQTAVAPLFGQNSTWNGADHSTGGKVETRQHFCCQK